MVHILNTFTITINVVGVSNIYRQSILIVYATVRLSLEGINLFHINLRTVFVHGTVRFMEVYVSFL